MSGRLWIGLFLVTIGLGFFLHQAEVWDFFYVLSSWWPLILIIIGVIQLMNRTISSISGLLFITVGSLFLINQWVQIDLTMYLWPIILILIGLTFIFSRRNRPKPVHSEHSIHTFVLFSGADIRSQSQRFEGGSVTAVFGGAEIDLRDVTFSDKGAKLDLTGIFGGVSLTVPQNVRVEVTGIPIFGGWENKTRQQMDEALPLLKVNCLAAFGGVEITN